MNVLSYRIIGEEQGGRGEFSNDTLQFLQRNFSSSLSRRSFPTPLYAISFSLSYPTLFFGEERVFHFFPKPEFWFTLMFYSALIKSIRGYRMSRNLSYTNTGLTHQINKIWRKYGKTTDQQSKLIHFLKFTHFSPVLHFMWKPVIWLAQQMKWLVSIWNPILGWNRLIK